MLPNRHPIGIKDIFQEDSILVILPEGNGDPSDSNTKLFGLDHPLEKELKPVDVHFE